VSVFAYVCIHAHVSQRASVFTRIFAPEGYFFKFVAPCTLSTLYTHLQVDNFCNSMPESLTRVMQITGKKLEYHEVCVVCAFCPRLPCLLLFVMFALYYIAKFLRRYTSQTPQITGHLREEPTSRKISIVAEIFFQNNRRFETSRNCGTGRRTSLFLCPSLSLSLSLSLPPSLFLSSSLSLFLFLSSSLSPSLFHENCPPPLSPPPLHTNTGGRKRRSETAGNLRIDWILSFRSSTLCRCAYRHTLCLCLCRIVFI